MSHAQGCHKHGHQPDIMQRVVDSECIHILSCFSTATAMIDLRLDDNGQGCALILTIIESVWSLLHCVQHEHLNRRPTVKHLSLVSIRPSGTRWDVSNSDYKCTACVVLCAWIRCAYRRHELSLRRRHDAEGDQTDEGSAGARRLQQHLSHDSATRLLDEGLQ